MKVCVSCVAWTRKADNASEYGERGDDNGRLGERFDMRMMSRRARDERNDLVGRVEGTGHVYISGGGRTAISSSFSGLSTSGLCSYNFATSLPARAHLPQTHLPRWGGGASSATRKANARFAPVTAQDVSALHKGSFEASHWSTGPAQLPCIITHLHK